MSRENDENGRGKSGKRKRISSQPGCGMHVQMINFKDIILTTGYMLLAGRVRKDEECTLIQDVIEKHLKIG